MKRERPLSARRKTWTAMAAYAGSGRVSTGREGAGGGFIAIGDRKAKLGGFEPPTKVQASGFAGGHLHPTTKCYGAPP